MPKPDGSPEAPRWFGGRAARALAEVEATLAQAGSVREVDAAHLRATCERHGVDLARQARGGRRRIYAQFLEHCLEDGELSDEELFDLAHLRELLHLDRGDLQATHEEVGRSVYGRALADVLGDLEIDETERSFLARLRDEIGLPETEASQLESRLRWEAREQALTLATEGDALFSQARASAGHFTGRSEKTLDDAIRDGLGKARHAIPQLHWFEVERIAGYVGEGGVEGWHVTLSAGLDPETLKRG